MSKLAWMQYADEVQKELKNMPPTTNVRRYERRLLERWQTACAEKGYTGSFDDWQFLLRDTRARRFPSRGKDA